MSRLARLRDAGLAVSVLTIVPTPARWPDESPVRIAGWFPLVGAALGGVGWAAVHAARLMGWQGGASLVVGALVVSAWALLTRFLHWDGLADVADGVWGAHDPARRLAIMADSNTGAFGAAAVAFVAIVEVAGVASYTASGHTLALLVVPILGRLSATIAAWVGSPARPGGFGHSVAVRPGLVDGAATAVVLAATAAAFSYGYGLEGALFVAGGVVLAAVVPHILSRTVGGVTGDIMGASVLICEAALFASAALAWGL